MLINILLLFLVTLRLVIGIQLFITARRNALPNLYWLSAVFIVNLIGLAFADVDNNPLGKLAFSQWLVNSFGFFTNLLLILFIHTTFYANKPSPYRLFLWAHAVLCALGFYGLTQSGNDSFSLSPYVAGFSVSGVLVWLWHRVVVARSLQSISNDDAVEDWVRARYQLMIWYTVFAVAYALSNAARIGFGMEGLAASLAVLATLLSNIVMVVLQFLVWVMPEWFRRWLNRNQQVHTEERLQEQALAILNILGAAMSEGTGLSSMSALIALRKALGQEIEAEDSAKIVERASTMGYREWQALLQSRDFYLWVESLGSQGNPRQAIENATRALTEKQSLFTMQAK